MCEVDLGHHKEARYGIYIPSISTFTRFSMSGDDPRIEFHEV